jgi:hypothetical protein
MGKYTKISLIVLYLFQVYMIFGEHIVETYHHVVQSLSPPATAAREFVANAVLKREVSATSQTGEKMHPAMGILHIPAALSLVLKDAHIVHPNDDDDGPEDKDRPSNRRRRWKERAPPNLFQEIKNIRPSPESSEAHVPAITRLTLFDANQA